MKIKCTIEQQHIYGTSSALAALQALVRLQAGDTGAQLWITTRAAAPAGQVVLPLNVAAAPLLGFSGVASLEADCAACFGGAIDLGFVGGEIAQAAEVSGLIDEMLSKSMGQESAGSDERVALRNGRRYVPRLRRTPALPAPQPGSDGGVRFESEATYLITGGVGALGLALATWMVRRGARRLVLTSRRGRPTSGDAITVLQQLEAQGATVDVLAADVTNATRMHKVIETANEDQRPLRRVVHAAGVLSFDALQNMDDSALRRVLDSKVRGAWILHALTRELTQLDHFVMYSSISSVWGAAEMAHYAAGNAFLDALAYHRRHLKLPALAVNWSVWGDIGMINQSDDASVYAKMGLNPVNADHALEALGRLMDFGRTYGHGGKVTFSGSLHASRVVADVDWQKLRRIFVAKAPFFSLLIDDVPSRSCGGNAGINSASTTNDSSAPVQTKEQVAAIARAKFLRGLVQSKMEGGRRLRPSRDSEGSCSRHGAR